MEAGQGHLNLSFENLRLHTHFMYNYFVAISLVHINRKN